MTDENVLWVGVDGLDVRLLNHFGHDVWEDLRATAAIVEVPKPEKIDTGDIGTASSPRMWARFFTGVGPYDSGILGFWERVNEDGDIVRAQVGMEWVRENECEKLVDRNTFLVPPVWTVALQEGRSVGLTTPWFSYPLTDDELNQLEQHGIWGHTDYPFPRDHEKMDRERMYYPPDAEPSPDFLDQVGAGFTINRMVQQDPEGTYEKQIQQDSDRYDYTAEQIERRGTPNLCMVYTRAVDGFAHEFTDPETIERMGEEFADPVENFRDIYRTTVQGIDAMLNAGNFDHVVISSDHGTGLETDAEGNVVGVTDNDHEWPGWAIIVSDEVPDGRGFKMSYEDTTATVLDLLGITPPDWYEGAPFHIQANVQERLRDLGYMPD